MAIREAIRASLGLLTRRDRRLLVMAALLQVATAGLDLVGVLLLGLVGALAVTTVQSQPPPQIVTNISDSIGLEGMSSQALVAVLGGFAATVLLLKSSISSFITRRTFTFLANRQALVSERLAAELLSRPITYIQKRTSQETAYALIEGATTATLRILGQSVIIVTEISVLAVLSVALLAIDPWMTLLAIAFFTLVALVLHRLMGNWAAKLGKVGREADIASLNTLQDALAAYRELTVLNRRELYVSRFQDLRWTSARVTADRIFIQQIPKYVFEAALVLGGATLAGALFVTKDSVAAIGTLVLFLAAASRVMPSLLRLQGAGLALRDNAASASATFELAAELENDQCARPLSVTHTDRIAFARASQLPIDISISNVTYSYPGARQPALSHATLKLAAGNSLALVGRSGSGKSTLVDLILGVLDPDQGDIRLAGRTPRQVSDEFPGSISYVPQTVALLSGTVRSNVALGLPSDAIDDEDVWRALDHARLGHVFRETELGLDAQIGEGGMKLSGGQRQRLGIARAFLSMPDLLVLDEATSALDAETEAAITEVVEGLHGEVTVVIVAHRLSTVRRVDTVAYLEDGTIEDLGTFDELRTRVPALAKQARLMGIS